MFSVFRGTKYDDIRPNHTKKIKKRPKNSKKTPKRKKSQNCTTLHCTLVHCSAFWGGRLKSTPKVIFWYFFVWFGLISSYLGPLNTENITWVQNGLIWFRPISCKQFASSWHIYSYDRFTIFLSLLSFKVVIINNNTKTNV